jgi:hypothetical protein
MTESEWLTGTNVSELLSNLPREVSERKLRLFATACCSRVWGLIADKGRKSDLRSALRLLDRYTDGKGSAEELSRARSFAFVGDVHADQLGKYGYDAVLNAAESFRNATDADPLVAACRAASSAIDAQREAAIDSARRAGLSDFWDADDKVFAAAWDAADLAAQPAGVSAFEAEQAVQATLLRCIFGNLFRPVSLDPGWRRPPVVSLARAAYKGRVMPEGTLSADRLAVLADALEDAGCTNPDLLSHLRGPGRHVRGCFAVDLLIGKG